MSAIASAHTATRQSLDQLRLEASRAVADLRTLVVIPSARVKIDKVAATLEAAIERSRYLASTERFIVQ